MNSHENAGLTALGRAELVRRVFRLGQPVAEVAAAFGVCAKTVRKWVSRFEAEGEAGLRDRSSRPHRLRRPTLAPTAARIAALRRERWTGQRIAAELGISPATVSRVLRRAGLSRLRDLAPAEPARRYERARPGEMIHIDIKKLGRFERTGHRITGDRRGQSNSRGVGWEYVHVCIDDPSRIAFTGILPDEKAVSAIAFLGDAVRFYARLGVTVERVMTDNGSCYKSFAFRAACRELGLRHIRTRPYTPRTNGKDQRQGRTLHQDRAPVMGLCAGLPDLGPAQEASARLAPQLQLAPTAWRHRIKATHQPTRHHRRQPVEAPQLGRSPRRQLRSLP